MANESSVRVGLTIRKVSGSLTLLDYNRSAGYQTTVTGTKGPTPGALTVTVAGEAVSLAELTTPGWCWLHNQSADYYVAIGVRDPDSGLFYPLLELLPGMRYPVYLSRDIGGEYTGAGTGTGVGNNQLWIKAFGGSANVILEAFER